MRKQLECSIVQDLLPNYIEKLTSDDTNIAIEDHLDNCEDCKKVYDQMIADVDTPEKAPVIELKFLKKVKKTRILAAALCVVITLVLSYLLYDSEYAYTSDKRDLSLAITEFTSPFEDAVDAYVLETKELDGVLIAFFKDQSKTNVYGFAVLNKGFNQKYRIVQTKLKSSDYSAVSLIYPMEVSGNKYYAVSGYNLSDEIVSYGVDFNYYTSPGYLSEDRVRETIKFNVKNPQFLEIYSEDEIDILLEKSMEEPSYNTRLAGTISFYDESGKEITDTFKKQESFGDVGSSIGKAELFMIYVFIVIIMGVGFIITRYFLTE